MILNIPLPQMLKMMMTASATTAMSQLVEALEMAELDRVRPMQMMMGPVTTGGRKRMTRLTPTILMTSASTRYRRPAMTNAAAGIGDLVIGAHGGIGAAVQVGNGGEAAQKCEGGAEEGWHLQLGAQMEDQGAHTGAEQVVDTVTPRVSGSPQAAWK